MKVSKMLAIVVGAGLMALALAFMAGCGAASAGNQEGSDTTQDAALQSPDKYTWYVRDYQGMNLANSGYVSLGEDLRDSYGAANIKLVPICVDGTYVDVSNEESLKDYSVIEQNIQPNTEIKLVFMKDEEGNEYDNLVDYANIDEIVLLVKKVGSAGKKTHDIPLSEIPVAPDAQTRYMKDYVGRNLAATGYISLGGDLRDEYGKGNIRIVPVADDGSYIDVSDIESLKQYYVVSQSIPSGSVINFTFMEGYDNLVESQSVEQIELRVARVAS